ncbi:Glucose/arabinose dehydrogenase, beta-propeller fold [Cognatiyoonia koreensis]|uniref:Glucose/arabinose dehydrogenase, beta-propeller fold n=1 Tax=Cognatiyoonia koreensis TaxID=364200 RepID=A0A1I0RHJ0_9RHOB|nr:PQQ-dependent sugar dehydrogenase [Cognatiyoonia koreensis]SEW40349.1 Glucose/arabinose dehydrogenase, beta-propeller fold [Cognatiyoonia koreensis]
MQKFLSSVAVATLVSSSTFAQTADVPDNLEKLSNFQSTGVTEFTFIEQTGEYADGIKATLEQISLPDGFKIELYAVVPDARSIAVGPQGIVTFVGTRKDKVWSVTDRNKDRIADEVKDFAPSLTFSIPNGPCFSKDGFLYIAEQNRVLLFPAAEFFYESPDVAAFNLIAQGDLIPPEEESFNHSARVCRVGPDDKVYISLGQPFNVAPPEKLDMYAEYGIGGIIRLNRDGTGREVYTYGVRNSVGHDFHPVTGELWWTDNQVDGMGDDIPPGELNRQTAMGQHFGAPWYGGGDIRVSDHGYDKMEVPVDVVMPVVETVAHAADLGMSFYTGDMFPAKYKNAIFSAQHGSWNRTEPVGARVMVTFIDEEGNATMEPFAEGWLDANGEYLGRPMDVAQLRDGSIIVSDDLAGALYRISYGE